MASPSVPRIDPLYTWLYNVSLMVHKQPSSLAFTLVELLVAIGTVTVLIALLISLLGVTRAAAGQARCASNLRQWAIAVNIYAEQNYGWLPRRGQGTMPTQTVTWYDDWFNELPPLLGQHAYQDLVTSGTVPRGHQYHLDMP